MVTFIRELKWKAVRLNSNLLVLPLMAFFTLPVNAQEKLETVVQRGHSLAVKTVCFSPDGNYLASGSEDKTIKIWEFSSGRELKTLNGHQSEVNQVLFTGDGMQLISASRDYHVYFWDIRSATIVKSFHYPDENIVSIALSHDNSLLAIGSTARVVRVIDLATDSLVYSFEARVGQYGAHVTFSEDDKLLAIGEDNRTVKLYNLVTGELAHTVNEPQGSCGGCDTRAVFLTDYQLVKGSWASPLSIRNFNTGGAEVLTEKMAEHLDDLELSPDKSLLMVVDEDSAVMWDMQAKQPVYTLARNLPETSPKYGLNQLARVPERRSDQFNDVAFSPDGKWLASGDNSNLVTIWDARTGEKVAVFYGYLSIPSDDGLNYDPNAYWTRYVWGLVALKNEVQLSPDGKYAFRAKVGYAARKWELATGKIVQGYFGHTKGVITFKLSADGRYLLTGSADRTAKLWDVATGKALRTFTGHRSFIYHVDFSHDGKKILTSSDDGTINIWELASGKHLKTIVLANDPKVIAVGYTVKFSPNDLYLLVGQTHGTFNMIEIDTGREFREFIGHTATVADFAFLSNGRQLVSAGWDNSLRLWDMASGMLVRKYAGHTGPVNSVALSEAGHRMASGGTDRQVILWDVATGKVIKKFAGHKSIVTSVAFSAGEKYLVSSTLDGITKIWDIETGREVLTHYSIGSRDWLVTTPQGYFNGTGDAQKQVFFVKGLESYTLDRFFDKYYNPEQIKRTFEIGPASPKQGLLQKLRQFPPPAVEISSPKQGEMVNKPAMEVLARIKNEGGGLKSVALMHNGKVVTRKEEAFYGKLAKGKSVYQKFNVQLVPGLNAIKVVAANKENIESRSSQVLVSYKSEEDESVAYVLAIGINKYRNPALDLNYAYDDAQAFAAAIKNSGRGLFSRVEVHKVLNQDATRANILGVLDILAQKVKSNDVFILYYAGHGTVVDNEFYFVPTENTRLYSADKLKKDGISATSLQQKLMQVPALKQLLLIDACQSGGTVELLAQRGAKEEKAMAQLSRSAGIHVLSAAGSEQFATEYAELGHGVFTYVLLEALAGKADGAPKDGVVTIYELKSYIENLVPEYSQKFKGEVQYPYTFSKGQDFPVSVDK